MMKSGPYSSARNFLACSKLLKILYHAVFFLADILRFWRKPQRYDPDLLKLWHDIHWYYKSGRPVTHPERGRREKDHFSRFRIHLASLLPDGLLEQSSLRMSSVGDLMSPSGIENSSDRLYESVSELIFDTDVSIANLESTPIAGGTMETRARLGEAPKINCTREQFNALKGHRGRNFTILTLSNNHILDSGLDGIRFTWNLLQKDEIFGAGINWTPGDKGHATVVERAGFRIGFATATYSVNLRAYPDNKSYLVNEVPFHRFGQAVDLTVLESQLEDCRTRGCDFAIAILHWGLEFELYPRWDQIEIAHLLAERGADLVISHHPHNIQPFELYRTARDSLRQVPVMYSLGNLTSIFASPFCSLSLILSLRLVRGMLPSGLRGTYIASVVLTPVIQMVFSDGEKTTFQIEKLANVLFGESARWNGKQKRFAKQAAKYADIVLGRGWRGKDNKQPSSK
jgi:poly-gamma-glutamate synthesis protein (capsule biosynthesis protein)